MWVELVPASRVALRLSSRTIAAMAKPTGSLLIYSDPMLQGLESQAMAMPLWVPSRELAYRRDASSKLVVDGLWLRSRWLPFLG